MTFTANSRKTPATHQRAAAKLARIPVKVQTTDKPLAKPDWIRIKVYPSAKVRRIKQILRQNQLHSVCEEAACPNLSECFSHGTASFMIMGDLCTRRCPFCDVAHGKPQPLDAAEPANLAKTIAELGLKYVVITSVDRDDLRDGGASHFAACVEQIRLLSPASKVELLVPDFRGRVDKAIAILQRQPCDVFNHNMETVPRLYKSARPGACYQSSLTLLQKYQQSANAITKSGIMLGLGERQDEVGDLLDDLYQHGCRMVTLGQYLQPSRDHLPVKEYITPAQFDNYATIAKNIGFHNVASAPLVRSSYHADLQAGQLA